jgi:hypothetical protein
LSSPLLKCAACYSRRTLHSRSLPKPLEGDHEVQVAALGVEPFSRRRTEQVEALLPMRSCQMAMFWTVIRRPAIRGFPPTTPGVLSMCPSNVLAAIL